MKNNVYRLSLKHVFKQR